MPKVILYHSTKVEPATVLGLWKEPLVIKLKQLGQLGGVQRLHRARHSSQAGWPRELAGTSTAASATAQARRRRQRPSAAAPGSCSSRLGDGLAPGGSAASPPILSDSGSKAQMERRRPCLFQKEVLLRQGESLSILRISSPVKRYVRQGEVCGKGQDVPGTPQACPSSRISALFTNPEAPRVIFSTLRLAANPPKPVYA